MFGQAVRFDGPAAGSVGRQHRTCYSTGIWKAEFTAPTASRFSLESTENKTVQHPRLVVSILSLGLPIEEGPVQGE
jgi:hypothetical protein